MRRGPTALCVGAAALVILAVGTACGADETQGGGRRLHVSVRGSDSDDGSPEHPWRTIGRALAAARPGDVLLVHEGRYRENLDFVRGGTTDAPVTLAAADGARVVVSGRLRIRASDAIVRGLVLDGGELALGVLVYVEGAQRVRIVRNDVVRSPRTGIFVGSGAAEIQIVANLVRDNGTRVGVGHGIALERGSNAIVASNVVDHNMSNGIQVYPAFDVALVNMNTVVGNGAAGILVGGEQSTSDDVTVVNNIVAFNGGQGVRTFWGGPVGRGNTARNNLIHGNIEDDRSRTAITAGANFTSDPGFVAPARRDFRLRPRSAAVGQAFERYVSAMDRDGTPRPQGLRADLGAYER